LSYFRRHYSPFLLPDAAFWVDAAQKLLSAKADKKPITGQAKNVIMFLGDGLSIPTLAATRVYLGQSQGKTGEETVLSFEEFPNTGLSKVRDTHISRQIGQLHATYMNIL
jgi:alkaline phosphatase